MRTFEKLGVALAVALPCALSSQVARAASCDAPPPPRFQPGQNSHYPDGADVITCSRPSANHEVWRIQFPSVDLPRTEYPAITFNSGDAITLSASGCVQRGGFGDQTWARYVNPDRGGGHLSAQHYGTVLWPGLTAVRFDQPILHWIGAPFTAPFAGHLILGYNDDNYGDNGYDAHDDGVNGQCAGVGGVEVVVTIDHARPPALSCPQWNTFVDTPVAPDQAALAKVASLLRDRAEVPLGLPITNDTGTGSITHFQAFQDGTPGSPSTRSNRPLNSAEMHTDGCVYVAFTPTTAPLWYPADIAFDGGTQGDWEMRPWDIAFGNRSLRTLEGVNHDITQWQSTFVAGECGGAGSRWRWTAPHWIKVCPPPGLPIEQWTAANISGFPVAESPAVELKQSGAICNFRIKQKPDPTDACIDSGRAEWSPVGDRRIFLTTEGTIENSFLSGGDFSGDHNGMPDGHFLGVHDDEISHTDTSDDCPEVASAISGEHCADWEANLAVDPPFRHLLAADESHLDDRDGGDCKANHPEYRLGNQSPDVGGSLGIEGEQWYYPLGFRPEPGDRAVIRGQWIVDCGHADWHTELHPATLIQSSYLQTNDVSPSLGLTWNRPLRLTGNWRAITGGAPAVITKIILSPVFADSSVEVDVWPPARPCAGARLVTAREDLRTNARWSGITVASETPLPADGNPNHLHVTFTRNSPYTLQFGGDGDVQNPDPNLTFFTAYMAWWVSDSPKLCQPPGGPGTGPPPSGGGCARGTGVRGTAGALMLAAVVAAAAVALARLRRRRRQSGAGGRSAGDGSGTERTRPGA
jgi:hypothetical protein